MQDAAPRQAAQEDLDAWARWKATCEPLVPDISGRPGSAAGSSGDIGIHADERGTRGAQRSDTSPTTKTAVLAATPAATPGIGRPSAWLRGASDSRLHRHRMSDAVLRSTGARPAAETPRQWRLWTGLGACGKQSSKRGKCRPGERRERTAAWQRLRRESCNRARRSVARSEAGRARLSGPQPPCASRDITPPPACRARQNRRHYRQTHIQRQRRRRRASKSAGPAPSHLVAPQLRRPPRRRRSRGRRDVHWSSRVSTAGAEARAPCQKRAGGGARTRPARRERWPPIGRAAPAYGASRGKLGGMCGFVDRNMTPGQGNRRRRAVWKQHCWGAPVPRRSCGALQGPGLGRRASEIARS